jgi:hypothetical protein
LTKKNTEVQEFRSSGGKKNSELGTLLRIGATEKGSKGFLPPLNLVSVATFQAGSESLSQRHSFLLNSSILSSFQPPFILDHNGARSSRRI